MVKPHPIGCGLLGLVLVCCQGKSEPSPSQAKRPGPTSAPLCAQMQAIACKELGNQSGVCGLFEKSQFPESRCQAMLADLPQTLKDLRQMERSREPLSEALAATLSEPLAPGFGAPDAKVTVIAFLDYDCPSCVTLGHYLPLLGQQLSPQELRVVVRQYPISGGKYGKLAAEGVLAASAQGKFLSYHECLYNNQHDLNPDSIERCAKEASVSLPEFTRALEQHEYAPQVAKDIAWGREALAGSVPYLFVNGKRLSGSLGPDALRHLIDETLAEVTANRVVTTTP